MEVLMPGPHPRETSAASAVRWSPASQALRGSPSTLGRRPLRLVPALAALLALVACSPPTLDSQFPAIQRDLGAAQSPDLGEEEAFPLESGPAEVESLSGVWLGAWEAHTCVEMGYPQSNVSVTWFLSELEQAGARLRERRRICRMEIGPVIGITTIIPDELLRAMGELRVDSTINGDRAGASYVSGEQVMLWGAKLDDPVADPLPSTQEDEGVYDTEGDERPGATLGVAPSVCDMGVAQRIITRQWGQLRSANGIEGSGAESNEQTVLWATSPMCNARFDTHPAPSRNRLRMLRVDGQYGSPDLDEDGDGEISCAEILEQRYRLLSPSEQDNAWCEVAE